MSASDCLHNDNMTYLHDDCMTDDMPDEINKAAAHHRPQPKLKEPPADHDSTHPNCSGRDGCLSLPACTSTQHSAPHTAQLMIAVPSAARPTSQHTTAVHTATPTTNNPPDNQHATPSELRANYDNDCLMTHQPVITQSACDHDDDSSPRLGASSTHSENITQILPVTQGSDQGVQGAVPQPR